MISAIFGILPDWAVGVLLALLVWFGVNYVWLGPTFITRYAVSQEAVLKCSPVVIRHYYSAKNYDIAVYTSSLGYIGNPFNIMDDICKDYKR